MTLTSGSLLGFYFSKNHFIGLSSLTGTFIFIFFLLIVESDIVCFRFQNLENIKDIYDGSEYRKNWDFLSKPTNISLTFNTDGVPLFKSTKMSVWPIYAVINELPPSMRFKRQYMLLCGLWFGSEKPHMNCFLNSFVSRITVWYEQGFYCTSPTNDKVLSRGFLLCGVHDLPARCAVQNMVQFNGEFGCSVCLQKGEVFSGDFVL
eukprot:Pompholyxophrys_punicea_v1_NODE_47_length_4460_cov_14.923496.p2 type:complete len:205 gc:universal NODE_47_length_4460_cov_14.923496:851-237(-)